MLVSIVAALARRGHRDRTRGDHSVSETDRRPVRRALISVYDKTGLGELAAGLHGAGSRDRLHRVDRGAIAEAGVPVDPVEQLTGFPECLDGRVKTLHPRVHAGLLADTRRAEHVAQLAELGIAPFDLLVVQPLPVHGDGRLRATPRSASSRSTSAGRPWSGPRRRTTTGWPWWSTPARYDGVLERVKNGGFELPPPAARRRGVPAHRGLRHRGGVLDGRVLAPDPEGGPFPAWVGATWERAAACATGRTRTRGPRCTSPGRPGLAAAEQLHGKEMSYNNYVDADAAWRAAHDHDAPCVAIIKHANPCGIAVGTDIADAHRKAHACDPVSAYGGVIAVNREVSVEMAEQVAEVFTEVVLAPGYADGALDVLTRKKNMRRAAVAGAVPRRGAELRAITGGLLLQQRDAIDAPGDDPRVLDAGHRRAGARRLLADLAFAWRACRSVKSNAILLAADGAAVGVGMGQVNRVDAARLAVTRAGDRARGSVAASDAFFPFPDGLQVLLDAGCVRWCSRAVRCATRR